MRTKFASALDLLSECRRARDARVGTNRMNRFEAVQECQRLDKMVRSLISHNEFRPISMGMTIFRVGHGGALLIEDANTPDMLELPDDMKE